MADAAGAQRIFDGLIENPGFSVVFTGYATPGVKESGADTWKIGFLTSLLQKPLQQKNRSKKQLRTFVDFVTKWEPPADFDEDALGAAWKNGASAAALELLPAGLRPGRELSSPDVMIIMDKNADGSYEVLKHSHLSQPVSLVDIDKMAQASHC